jgi:glycosyltransferase involved in cell wall biosynthesis
MRALIAGAGGDDNVGGARICGPATPQLPMRVIHLARYAGPYPGSFIAMLRAAASACERRGWRTEAVFDPVAADRPWYGDLAREMPVRVGSRDAEFVRAVLDEDEGPAILHTHFTGFDLAAASAARGRPGTAVVWHLHTRLEPGPRAFARNVVKFALIGRRVSRIVCAGPEVGAAARGRCVPRSRLEVLDNAIDTSSFPLADAAQRRAAREELAVPNGAPVLVHLGWNWEMKGGPLFAETAEALRRRGVDAVPVSVGAAPEAAGDTVLTRPPTDHVERVYASADVLVSASEVEGGPFSVLEALCVGTPVVASPRANAGLAGAVAACRVAERTPEAFADAIEATLARSPEQAEAERDAAREFVTRERDTSAWAERLLAIYDRALER